MNVIKSERFFEARPRPLTASHDGAVAAQPGCNLVASVSRLCERAAGTGPIAADILSAALTEARAAADLITRQADRLDEVERLCVTDELTGLVNRRGFEAALRRATSAARRYQETGVLIFIDLDGFKPINDSFGHAAGDAVLVRVAEMLADNIRDTDAAGRLGGDEFAVLLARTGWNAGLRRAETLDRIINAATLEWDGCVIAVRASLGFQTYGEGSDADALLASADHAMYSAKRARADAGA